MTRGTAVVRALCCACVFIAPLLISAAAFEDLGRASVSVHVSASNDDSNDNVETLSGGRTPPRRHGITNGVAVGVAEEEALANDAADAAVDGVRTRYPAEETFRHVYLAGAAYCDRGLATWDCQYCNGTSVRDVTGEAKGE